MAQAFARPLQGSEANVETQPFWDAAAEGRLMIKRCRACTKPHYYPRAICPHCFSDDTVWEESRGEAEIYTLSVTRRGPEAPYALAYVILDEGPAILTNIVDCDVDALRIGGRVRVRFTPAEGGAPVPTFTPIDA